MGLVGSANHAKLIGFANHAKFHAKFHAEPEFQGVGAVKSGRSRTSDGAAPFKPAKTCRTFVDNKCFKSRDVSSCHSEIFQTTRLSHISDSHISIFSSLAISLSNNS